MIPGLTAEERVALRCAEQCKAMGGSPLATAPSVEGLLLVELALPWPKDVGDDPRLVEVALAAARHGHRLQALVADGRSPEGHVHLIRYARPDHGFDRFARSEAVVPISEVGASAEELLAAPVATGPPPGGVEEGDVVDVLVCSHGARDACCGRAGIPLFRELGGRVGPQVRVWRTSHLGGHRFAPTALVLPEGRAWAWVEADELEGIIDRTLPLATALGHDRGCAGMADAWQQAADHAALGIEGWAWLDARRSGRTEPAPASPEGRERRRVALTGTRPDGSVASYDVVVEVARVVPVPVCGHPLDEATKSEPELRVVSIDPIGAGGDPTGQRWTEQGARGCDG